MVTAASVSCIGSSRRLKVPCELAKYSACRYGHGSAGLRKKRKSRLNAMDRVTLCSLTALVAIFLTALSAILRAYSSYGTVVHP
jgi:hypothetical protein